MKCIWLFDRKYIVIPSDMTYLAQIKLKCRITNTNKGQHLAHINEYFAVSTSDFIDLSHQKPIHYD